MESDASYESWVQSIADDIDCGDFDFVTYGEWQAEKCSGVFIAAHLQRPDRDTGVPAWSHSALRPWSVQKPEGWTDALDESGIVREFFEAAVELAVHEVHESFTYKGKRVFDPHVRLDI